MLSLIKKTVILLTILNLVYTEEKVLQVIGLIRSGASFPEKGEIISKIESKQYTSDESIRKYITGNGLRSSFILGQKIAETYPFVKKYAFRLKDFQTVASSTDRTDMTAQAMLFGIFGKGNDTRTLEVDDFLTQPPFDNQTVNNEFDTALPDGIYPVPFESFNEQFNNVLMPWGSYSCKNFETFFANGLTKHNNIIEDFNKILDNHKVHFIVLFIFIKNTFIILFDFMIS